MKSHIVALFLLAGVAAGATAAEEKGGMAGLSDKERVDYLLKQNQALMEENARLQALADRPRTREEAFTACMQATRGQSNPMTAESIGEHCDQLLKRPAPETAKGR